MYKILSILFLLPHFLKAQLTAADTLTFFPGEYTNCVLNSNTHTLYNIVNTPFIVAGLPNTIIGGAGGAHHSIALSSDGTIYGIGDNQFGELGNGNTTNQATWVHITTDSLGNPLNNIRKVYCG